MPGGETKRQTIAALLRSEALTLHELSQCARVSEKDLPEHLEHLARSAAASRERLRIEPATCIACGFVFGERQRFTRPGKCPTCHSTRITPARFRLSPG